MKLTFAVFIIVCLPMGTFAQTNPQLKSEVVAKEKRNDVESTYPRITLNEAKCRFSHVSLGSDERDQYNLTFVFSTPCNRENEVSVGFNSLEDALMVKDLVLMDSSYDFIHLTKPETGHTQFEIVYKSEKK